MAGRSEGKLELGPELLLQAYASGVFPMAESADDPTIFWVAPNQRGIFELDRFHISRSLARHIRQQPFEIALDRDFEGVLRGCADRPETWINPQLFELYLELLDLGVAHSLETWQGNELVGGVYGITLGGCFFGESMFSRRTNASKIALAYLVSRLRFGGFTLFDTQFLTAHLASLGAIEISRADYHVRLARALDVRADFGAQPLSVSPTDVLQASTQTS